MYKGVLQDGSKVAIKQLDQASKQGEQEFRVEVDVLSCLHSPYLLALIGYCADHDHRLLVYECSVEACKSTFTLMVCIDRTLDH